MNIKETAFEYISQWKVLIPMILLFFGIEGAFTFWLMPGFIGATGGGILDMAMAYNPSRAFDFLVFLQAGGLPWYNRIQIFDFFFPFSYSLALAGILYRIYRRKYRDFSKYLWILMIPIIGGVCDLGENIFIRIMIIAGEGSIPFLGWITSALSTVKFLALGLSILFILTGLAYFLRGRKDAFKK